MKKKNLNSFVDIEILSQINEVDSLIEKLKNGEYISNDTIDKLTINSTQEKTQDFYSAYWQIKERFGNENLENTLNSKIYDGKISKLFEEKFLNFIEIQKVIVCWQKIILEIRKCFENKNIILNKFAYPDKYNLNNEIACVVIKNSSDSRDEFVSYSKKNSDITKFGKLTIKN